MREGETNQRLLSLSSSFSSFPLKIQRHRCRYHNITVESPTLSPYPSQSPLHPSQSPQYSFSFLQALKTRPAPILLLFVLRTLILSLKALVSALIPFPSTYLVDLCPTSSLKCFLSTSKTSGHVGIFATNGCFASCCT